MSFLNDVYRYGFICCVFNGNWELNVFFMVLGWVICMWKNFYCSEVY